MTLFWQHGYEATSLADLVEATGAKAPTLYAEFVNKEGLFQSTPAGQHKVGTISASAGTNLGSLEDQLAQKADEMGATSYRITSVTGPNTLHGTAVMTLPITLNAAMTAFKQAPQTDGTVMERAMNYRSGMPIDVTRHAEPGPQSL